MPRRYLRCLELLWAQLAHSWGSLRHGNWVTNNCKSAAAYLTCSLDVGLEIIVYTFLKKSTHNKLFKNVKLQVE